MKRNTKATGFKAKVIENHKVRGTIIKDMRPDDKGKMYHAVVGYQEPKQGLTMGDQVALKMGISKAA